MLGVLGVLGVLGIPAVIIGSVPVASGPCYYCC